MVDELTVAGEQNRHAQGQRRVNIIWEITQAFVALAVTSTSLYVFAQLAVKDQWTVAAIGMLSNAFFLVIGFYFGRTNHQRTGGVGGESAGTR